jgi:hypothetical protein
MAVYIQGSCSRIQNCEPACAFLIIYFVLKEVELGTGPLLRMNAMRNTCKILLGKPRGKRTLGISRQRWILFKRVLKKYDVNIWNGFIWLEIGTSDRILNKNFGFYKRQRISCLAGRLLISEDGAAF